MVQIIEIYVDGREEDMKTTRAAPGPAISPSAWRAGLEIIRWNLPSAFTS